MISPLLLDKRSRKMQTKKYKHPVILKKKAMRYILQLLQKEEEEMRRAEESIKYKEGYQTTGGISIGFNLAREIQAHIKHQLEETLSNIDKDK